MAEKAPSNDIDTQTAAALLKVTPRWIQQLAKDGWFKPRGRGKWSLVEVVQGYIDFLKDENARKTKSAGDSDLKRARAREVEMRIAEKDRRLVDLDEALAEYDQATGVYLQSIGGMPARITRNPRERQRLAAIFDAERQRLADHFAERRKVLRSGVETIDADDEDDA